MSQSKRDRNRDLILPALGTGTPSNEMEQTGGAVIFFFFLNFFFFSFKTMATEPNKTPFDSIANW